MHNATTKQRLSALRRKLGIFLGAPRWVRQRRERLARVEAKEQASLAASQPPPEPTCVLSGQADGVFQAAVTEPGMPPFAAVAVATATEPGFRPARPRAEATERVAIAPREGRAVWWAVAITMVCIAMLAGSRLRGGLARRAATTPTPTATSTSTATAAAADNEAVHPERPSTSPPLRGGYAQDERATDEAARSRRAATSTATQTRVARGDTLWHLADLHLGDPERWPLLFVANHGRIRDPNLIYPGQELTLPAR